MGHRLWVPAHFSPFPEVWDFSSSEKIPCLALPEFFFFFFLKAFHLLGNVQLFLQPIIYTFQRLSLASASIQARTEHILRLTYAITALQSNNAFSCILKQKALRACRRVIILCYKIYQLNWVPLTQFKREASALAFSDKASPTPSPLAIEESLSPFHKSL